MNNLAASSFVVVLRNFIIECFDDTRVNVGKVEKQTIALRIFRHLKPYQ